jgi:hypothetical protein
MHGPETKKIRDLLKWLHVLSCIHTHLELLKSLKSEWHKIPYEDRSESANESRAAIRKQMDTFRMFLGMNVETLMGASGLYDSDWWDWWEDEDKED